RCRPCLVNPHELDQRLEIVFEVHGDGGTEDGWRVYRARPGKASTAKPSLNLQKLTCHSRSGLIRIYLVYRLRIHAQGTEEAHKIRAAPEGPVRPAGPRAPPPRGQGARRAPSRERRRGRLYGEAH